MYKLTTNSVKCCTITIEDRGMCLCLHQYLNANTKAILTGAGVNLFMKCLS